MELHDCHRYHRDTNEPFKLYLRKNQNTFYYKIIEFSESFPFCMLCTVSGNTVKPECEEPLFMGCIHFYFKIFEPYPGYMKQGFLHKRMESEFLPLEGRHFRKAFQNV